MRWWLPRRSEPEDAVARLGCDACPARHARYDVMLRVLYYMKQRDNREHFRVRILKGGWRSCALRAMARWGEKRRRAVRRLVIGVFAHFGVVSVGAGAPLAAEKREARTRDDTTGARLDETARRPSV